MTEQYRLDPFPSDEELNALMATSWDVPLSERQFGPVLDRSLAHVGAYENDVLIGFVNVAWDGAAHAFILDTCVHPDCRHRGIATRLVQEARRIAKHRGAEWLHVDFEPHLEQFYRGCGFRPSAAGLLNLRE